MIPNMTPRVSEKVLAILEKFFKFKKFLNLMFALTVS